MKCKIAFSDVGEKFARVNFVHPMDAGKKIVREAAAFPWRFTGNGKVAMTLSEFDKLLSPGCEVDIVWSKKLQKYVVRFS